MMRIMIIVIMSIIMKPKLYYWLLFLYIALVIKMRIMKALVAFTRIMIKVTIIMFKQLN